MALMPLIRFPILLAALVAASCSKPSFGDCSLRCDQSGVCPSDFGCNAVDGFCYDESVASPLPCAERPVPDAGPSNANCKAERITFEPNIADALAVDGDTLYWQRGADICQFAGEAIRCFAGRATTNVVIANDGALVYGQAADVLQQTPELPPLVLLADVEPTHVALSPGSDLFWSERPSGAIRFVGPQDVVETIAADTTEFVITDDGDVIWLDQVDVRILRSGAAESKVLATVGSEVHNLLASGPFVYWIEGANVFRYSTTSEEVSQAASRPGNIGRSAAIDANAIYWHEGRSIMRLRHLVGGQPQLVISSETGNVDDTINSIIVGNEHFYWTDMSFLADQRSVKKLNLADCGFN